MGARTHALSLSLTLTPTLILSLSLTLTLAPSLALTLSLTLTHVSLGLWPCLRISLALILTLAPSLTLTHVSLVGSRVDPCLRPSLLLSLPLALALTRTLSTAVWVCRIRRPGNGRFGHVGRSASTRQSSHVVAVEVDQSFPLVCLKRLPQGGGGGEYMYI